MAILGIIVALSVTALGGIIWSWARWARTKQPRTVFSTLSLVGLALATASALLAILPLLVRGSFGMAQGLAPALSLTGVLFALGGVRRTHALRWHSLGCAVAMFLFWLASLMSG